MRGYERDERSTLVLKIRESVKAGTYRVAPEDVAAAIIAGPFAASVSPELLLADRVARLTQPTKTDDHQ